MQDEKMAAKLAIKINPGCVNEFSTARGTSLQITLFERFESMVKFLLERCANPNAVDQIQNQSSIQSRYYCWHYQQLENCGFSIQNNQ